jgi:hypothetical protein
MRPSRHGCERSLIAGAHHDPGRPDWLGSRLAGRVWHVAEALTIGCPTVTLIDRRISQFELELAALEQRRGDLGCR